MWKLSQWWQLSVKRELTSLSSWEIFVGFNCRFWSYWLVVVCTLTDYCGCTSWLRYACRVFLGPFCPSLSPSPFPASSPTELSQGSWGSPQKRGCLVKRFRLLLYTNLLPGKSRFVVEPLFQFILSIVFGSHPNLCICEKCHLPNPKSSAHLRGSSVPVNSLLQISYHCNKIIVILTIPFVIWVARYTY